MNEDEQEVEMDMTPMIDVSFQLLIFFILTINFKIQEGNLSTFLPLNKGMSSAKTKPKQLDKFKMSLSYDEANKETIVEMKGKIIKRWKNGEPIPQSVRDSIGQRAYKKFKSINQQAKETAPVKIESKPEVPSGRTVIVLDILKKHILDNPEFRNPKLEWAGNTRQDWAGTP